MADWLICIDNMPRFQHTEYLWFLALMPALAGLFAYAIYRKKKAAKQLGDPVLVQLLSRNYNPRAYLVKFILIAVAIGLFVVTIANLRSPVGSEKVSRSGIDVMIALDVSKSMLARDIKPTRLDRARQVLSRLVDRLTNDRVGIVVFAGKAYLQMPLTADHAAAKMYLSAASTESVPTQGTVIGSALKMCYSSFNTQEKKYKAIVLVSDGEDHDEEAVRLAKQMSQEGVVIYTVGIGSPQGVTLLDETTNQPKTDAQGNPVISRLNEEELRQIAQEANGQYILFQNTDAVVDVITKQLAGMDQRNVSDDSLINYKSWFQYFLLAILLLLLAESFISENRRLKRATMKPLVTILFIFLGLQAGAQTNNEQENIKQGNDLYKKGDYDKASEKYKAVADKNPENATASFNNGNALYRSGKKEEALDAYDNSLKNLKTPAEKSNAYYNKVVVLQNDKKLEACIDAYKQSLKLDPTNEDARQNLQKALQQQKQEQQQKQKQDQQKKQQDQQKQDQKKDKQEQKPQEPRPQPSKISKKEAEEKLKALMQQEKNLQDKLHKVPATSINPEKDW